MSKQQQGSVKKSIVTRVRLAFLGVLLFSAAVVWKIQRIQYQEGEKWRSLEQQRRIVYQPVFATRGSIFAADGRSIMATSLPFYRVAWDPSVVSEELFASKADSLAMLLSRFFGDRSKEEYLRRLKNAHDPKRNVRYIRLNSRQINFQEKKLLASWPIFRAKRKGGVIFEKVDKRFRPFGGLAQRTIGFVNEEKHGAGLEYTYNKELAGKDGEALFERLPGGLKPVYDGSEIKPQAGFDIMTTIDINLQDVAENALLRSLMDNNAQYGTVILMEVQTGEIKAVANLGKVADGVYREDYNYAIADQGRTEPGSTFKLASMMALFEDNPELDLTDTVNTGRTGSMKIAGAVKTDSHPYGKITVQQVFEKSSNIGVAKLVNDHFMAKPSDYTDYLKKFGLHQPLGFQMSGEAKPYVKDPSDRSWSHTSLSTMSIGYELKLAPLQTLAFYNAVANGGVKIQPIIVKEIRQDEQVLERFETKVLNPKICSDATLAKVKAMMEGVVTNGTARGIRTPDFGIAGKTGTAWKFKNGRYTKTYSTSFCGYFPADKPKYSCIVVVDSPKNGRIYGADVAAPVFREVADKAMARDQASQRPLLARAPVRKTLVPSSYGGVQEDLQLICNHMGVTNQAAGTAPDDWVQGQAAEGARHVQWNALPVRRGRMPSVAGLSRRDALFLLENRGLRVRTVGAGRVTRQSVPAGLPVTRGAVVTLELKDPTLVAKAPVPVLPYAPPKPTVAPEPTVIPEPVSPTGQPITRPEDALLPGLKPARPKSAAAQPAPRSRAGRRA
ncbi:PASTA domain-containing protein [Hymenobacter sp. 15J16-1T3B]|uniref:penicillin-binding transpeptidase domain-containing protein n=1 Tax=Hymenobacter sp. 15J16-1T3B TaxID=2886941 RepID=UPI001D1163AC|nr:penicillin-binding transpeptidase domain-containing protein [Hymenobacter sp. 15J16-1T3B]MCC3158179.1 PASTA domain-containing protein [Hymenobacter sp. 15J16-1T3B]